MRIYLSLNTSFFMQLEIKDGITLCLQHTKDMELLKQVQRKATSLVRRLVRVPCDERARKPGLFSLWNSLCEDLIA